jgi:hypothetical protein
MRAAYQIQGKGLALREGNKLTGDHPRASTK